MQNIILKVDGQPDISFIGDLVAEEVDPNNGGHTKVFATEKGHWLVAMTNMREILIQHKVINNQSHDELISTLGFSNLAKSIYQQLGINTAKNLDI
ncbi:hypothetical protein [Atlantibacter hermannii]|uniref:hypothetical protein n=1 Tax=Atlantibacter hermannii TaxID=565 RepID=UPI0028B00370|nr:hypothetical protein [Atlantibacter hermannii]